MAEIAGKWVSFYGPAFPSRAEAEAFVERCEAAPTTSPAKVMMHQVQRLVSLGDELAEISRRDPLQVLFLVICAECVAKLEAGFKGEGKSKPYVRKFFSAFLSPTDGNLLSNAFTRLPALESLTVEEAVDLLYDIRCDVVHEGQYWEFFFHDGDCTMFNPTYKVCAHVTIGQLRNLVVRTAVRAIEARL